MHVLYTERSRTCMLYEMHPALYSLVTLTLTLFLAERWGLVTRLAALHGKGARTVYETSYKTTHEIIIYRIHTTTTLSTARNGGRNLDRKRQESGYFYLGECSKGEPSF